MSCVLKHFCSRVALWCMRLDGWSYLVTSCLKSGPLVRTDCDAIAQLTSMIQAQQRPNRVTAPCLAARGGGRRTVCREGRLVWREGCGWPLHPITLWPGGISGGAGVPTAGEMLQDLKAESCTELTGCLQGVAERLHALKQNKAEVEARAAGFLLDPDAHFCCFWRAWGEVSQGSARGTAWAQASSGSLEQAKAALEAELEQAQAAVSAAEEAKAELAAKVQESKDAAEAAERFKAQLQPSLQSFEDQISVLEAQLPKPVQAHCACCLLAAMFGAARFGQVVQISSANQPVQAHPTRFPFGF